MISLLCCSEDEGGERADGGSDSDTSKSDTDVDADADQDADGDADGGCICIDGTLLGDDNRLAVESSFHGTLYDQSPFAGDLSLMDPSPAKGD